MNLLSFFSPYKLLIEVTLIGSLIAGIRFGIHQFLSYELDIGYQKAVAEYTKRGNAALKAAADKATAPAQQLAEANNHAQAREQTIKTLSVAAGAASVSLRDAIGSISRGASTASVDALRKSTATLATVFNDCQGKYRAMAEIADRHASDTKTLTEAWPK